MTRCSLVIGLLALPGLVACEDDANTCLDGELSCDSSLLILQGCVSGQPTEERDCEAEGLECHADMGTPHCGPAGMGMGM
ncbi:MAG: hypothetical protein AAF602_02335 [Myxococcota bacterium]